MVGELEMKWDSPLLCSNIRSSMLIIYGTHDVGHT